VKGTESGRGIHIETRRGEMLTSLGRGESGYDPVEVKHKTS
jgi:hypothetical protein